MFQVGWCESAHFLSFMENQLKQKISSANIPNNIVEEILTVFNNLSTTKQKTLLRIVRTFTLTQFVKSEYVHFTDFFTVKKGNEVSSSGVGHGEIMILLAVKNSSYYGLAHGDVKLKNKIVEVKQVSRGNQFRIGYAGNLNISNFMYHIVSFYQILHDFDSANPKLNEIINDYFKFQNCFETIYKFNEIGKRQLESMYCGFKILHNFFIEFEAKYTIGKIGEHEFIIDNAILKTLNFKKTNNESIDVLHIPIIKDVSMQDAHIKIKKIVDHPYVQNPKLFILDLLHITKMFFDGIDYLLLYDDNANVIKLCNKKCDNLCISRITQSRFKMQYLKCKSKYSFIEDQKLAWRQI